MGLDSVELVMEFEDEFKIEIPDSVAEKMLTIGDVVRFITRQKKLPENDTVGIQTVRDRVCQIVREQMGGNLPPITDESRFYEDLGVT